MRKNLLIEEKNKSIEDINHDLKVTYKQTKLNQHTHR